MATRSKYKEMADEEAARAEADPDDEDTDEDADGEAETPPDEAASDPDAEPQDEDAELSVEARAKLFETALRLHHDNMAGFFGEDWADMELCAVCNGVGAHSVEAPVADPDTARCEKCKGWGILLTEAQDPNHAQRQCPQCLGNGYVPKPIYVEPAPQAPQVAMPGNFQTSPTPNQPAAPAAPTIPPMPIYDAQANAWVDPATGTIIGNGATPAAQPAAVA